MAANFSQVAEQCRHWEVDRCCEQFADVDISLWTKQQITEAGQTARGFEDCNLPLITNRPVITPSYKYRLFESTQDRASRERFLQAFRQDAHEFPVPVDVLIKVAGACDCYALQNRIPKFSRDSQSQPLR